MAAHALLSPTDPAAAGRRPWWPLALTTAAVAAVHLALLGLATGETGPTASPLADRFVTRTIVIAPPTAAAAPPAAPPAAPVAQPKPPPVPRARRAPAAVPPQVEDTVAETPATPAPNETATTVAEAAPDAPTPAPPAAAASAPQTAASAPTAAASAPDSSAPVAQAPLPLRIPGSVTLRFAVTGQQGTAPMQGVFGELNWLQDGRNYDARLALTIFFKTLRAQHSTGVIGPTGIEPERFSDARRSEVASHFVREQGVVVFSNNAPSVPLLPGAQDRLSIVMQLGALIAGDPTRYPTGGVIAAQTVGPRDADLWTFQIGEEETLQLPAGDIVARRLTRSPRKPFDDTVEVWVAPALGYLPVRIKQTQPNGDFADMQLREQLPLQPPK